MHSECCVIINTQCLVAVMEVFGGIINIFSLGGGAAAAFPLLGLIVPSLISSSFSILRSFFFFYYKYYLHNSLSFTRPIKRSLGFPLAATVDGFPQRPQHGPPCHEFELKEN